MIVTKQWLKDNATLNGSWTRAQLNVLGIEWPPAKGWQDRISGKVLNDREVEQFKAAKYLKGKGDIHAIYSDVIRRLHELPEIELIILRNKINSIVEVKR